MPVLGLTILLLTVLLFAVLRLTILLLTILRRFIRHGFVGLRTVLRLRTITTGIGIATVGTAFIARLRSLGIALIGCRACRFVGGHIPILPGRFVLAAGVRALHFRQITAGGGTGGFTGGHLVVVRLGAFVTALYLAVFGSAGLAGDAVAGAGGTVGRACGFVGIPVVELGAFGRCRAFRSFRGLPIQIVEIIAGWIGLGDRAARLFAAVTVVVVVVVTVPIVIIVAVDVDVDVIVVEAVIVITGSVVVARAVVTVARIEAVTVVGAVGVGRVIHRRTAPVAAAMAVVAVGIAVAVVVIVVEDFVDQHAGTEGEDGGGDHGAVAVTFFDHGGGLGLCRSRWRRGIGGHRIILRHIDHFRTRRRHRDVLDFIDGLRGYSHFRRGCQGTDIAGLTAQALHGLHHTGLVIDVGLSQFRGPVHFLAQHVHGFRELYQGQHRRGKAFGFRGLIQGFAFQGRIIEQPVTGIQHFLRVGRSDQHLFQHGIRIQGNRRQQLFHGLRRPRGVVGFQGIAALFGGLRQLLGAWRRRRRWCGRCRRGCCGCRCFFFLAGAQRQQGDADGSHQRVLCLIHDYLGMVGK